jgi:hypothetical protein
MIPSPPFKVKKDQKQVMNSDHQSQLLWRYAALEKEVQTLIRAKCGIYCELCTSRCCRADRCIEAMNSPFLRWVHQHEENNLTFTDQNGWLNEKGCALSIGRPPACYEFFCDDVLDTLPDEGHRYAVRLLGKLVDYIGHNAVEKTHLVEIESKEDLKKISLEKFKEQLNAARSALDHVKFFFENGFFDGDAAMQFEPIFPLPPELA